MILCREHPECRLMATAEDPHHVTALVPCRRAPVIPAGETRRAFAALAGAATVLATTAARQVRHAHRARILGRRP